jgi:ParB/RepB/Spo0J family partition protein
MEKSKPSCITVPVKALLSMPFQSRTTDPELDELADSIKTYGVLEPILVRPKPSGLYEIVAGERRVKAAEKAGLTEVPVIITRLTDDEAYIVQAIENLQRKDWTEEEKTRYLGWLAKKTGWNAQQISEKLKMSYTWVLKYLPIEFKAEEKVEAGRLGGEARAEVYRESQDSATRRIAETKLVPCARCGVATSKPVHLGGKFYCGACAQARLFVQPEAGTSTAPPLPSEPARTGPSEEKPIEAPKPEPKVVKIDTGFRWTCPECGREMQLLHVKQPNGKINHEFEGDD